MTQTAKTKTRKVAIVSSHPTQWEGPFFGYLQQQSHLDIRVLFESRLGLGSEHDSESGVRVVHDIPGILEGYESIFSEDNKRRNALDARTAVFNRLDALIVEGHSGALQRKYLAWALYARIPAIYRSDSTLLYPAPAWKRILKRTLLPFFFRRFRAFLPLSTPASDYLQHYGVPKSAIYLSPYMVHNEWYEEETNRWRSNLETTKDALGLSSFERVVLAVLRFEDRENPLEFLEAAAGFAVEDPKTAFVLIGDGSLRASVEDFVRESHCTNTILPGYVPLSKLPEYYAVADVFVHPAWQECWGLSVNEAMACSVPVVISTGVGCRIDLIPNDRFGLVYPTGNIGGLLQGVRSYLERPEHAKRVASEARERLKSLSYEVAMGKFEAAVDFAAQRWKRGVHSV